METLPKILKKGFYWVKLDANTRSNSEHWEPAYFNGDEIDGWGLCGQDPILDETYFLDIKNLEMVFPDE